MENTDSGKRSSPLLIALTWLVVIVPAGWGLRYTVQNALKIFAHPDPAATAPATSPATSPATPATTAPTAPH